MTRTAKELIDRTAARQRRHHRVRQRVSGTPDQPRLTVFRSNRGIYAQLVDDINGTTLASSSSQELGESGLNKCQVAEKVGEALAKKAKEKNIERVVFDRGGYLYHGRVKALAEAARKSGLKL